MRTRFITAVALVSSLGLLAAACGDDEGDSADTTAASGDAEGGASESNAAGCPEIPGAKKVDDSPIEQVGLVFDAVGRGDGSFNDAAACGFDLGKANFGYTGSEQVPKADGSDRADKLSLLCGDGYNPVIAVGFLFAEPLAQVAPECPDTSFGVIDSVVEAPNVAGLVFAEEQGSALVGAGAATMTEADKVGFIGGMEIDLIKKFEAGYKFGVEQVNPDVEVLSKYIGTTVEAFNDTAKAKEIAKAMIDEGADVIYHAAGQSGIGLFEAVKEANDAGTKVWAIGVDSDQASPANGGVPDEVKDYILTSMLKRVDVAVYGTLQAVNDGTFAAGPQVFDLAKEGVGYATTGDHLSDDAISAMDDLKEKIVNGDVEVPTAP